MKIQILNKIIYLWDVFFTWLDNSQLRIWYSLVQYRDKSELRQIQVKKPIENIYNVQPLDSWENIND